MAEPQIATIKCDSSGDLFVPFTIIYGNEAFAQRLEHRFGFGRGEWFLDQRQGVPYFKHVLGKTADDRAIRTIFRSIILNTPGAKSITKFDLVYDKSDRSVALDFEATTTDGGIFRSQPEQFIIKFPDR